MDRWSGLAPLLLLADEAWGRFAPLLVSKGLSDLKGLSLKLCLMAQGGCPCEPAVQ